MDEGSDKAPRRKRVSRACDRCRSKKDKCDGIRPTCSACQASGQTCSYDPHAKKRGLPEGYVRGLEKLWALSICNIDGFEDTMLAMLGTTAESASRRGKLMSVWAEDTASESLHETWKTSRLYGALEKMLSNSEPLPTATGKRSRNDNDLKDPDDRWGYRVGRESTPLGPEAPRVVAPFDVPSSTKRARLAQVSESRGVSSANGPHALQLPPQTSQLLDIYFAATHSWFPVIAKHNVLRASYLYANSPLSVATTSPGSGDHAALWAILSYTITQSQTHPRVNPVGAVSLAKEYYAVSRNLIPTEKERFELGHIQALLLLTLVNIGLEDWTAAWLLGGQAIRMAIAMGLGAYTDTRRSDELRQGKAVFLGCFVIDSLMSFRLSRCPALSANDFSTVGLLEEDGLEEWNSWVDVLPPTGVSHGKNPPRRGPLLAISCFNRLVELASVLNRISRNAMGYKAPALVQQLVMDLKQWDDTLPLGCRLIGPESIYPERHSALLPHQSYLGLTYAATLLWLYLRLIPGEQGLHQSQRPATEGAKKLLYRGLSMITQHLENFPVCGIPPIFEVGLRTISEQAFSLQHTLDSTDNFPFARWGEEFRHKTAALVPTWPVYESLVSSMGRWQQPNGFPGAAASAFSGNAGAPTLTGTALGAGPMKLPGSGHGIPPHDQGNYASSILGISIPVDVQSMTPKDTVMGNADLGMTDVPLQQAMDSHAMRSDNLPPRSGPEVLYQPGSAHQQPQTPDSSTPHSMMVGKAPMSDRSGPTSDGMAYNPVESGDLDAIFKDLAYLDTTEWSTNREAGLRDFGFMDDTTFQAFCHDPDRLVRSQPLVHPPSIADIWPPPGFFPETFHNSPENSMGG